MMQENMHYTLGSLAFLQAFRSYTRERDQQRRVAEVVGHSTHGTPLRSRVGGLLSQMGEGMRSQERPAAAPAEG